MKDTLQGMLASLLFVADTGAMAAGKPNIIVILVDDLGWMDLSCQGSDYYRTPAVDRIAADGMRFTDANTACSVRLPARAAVQTGRYPHRVGVTDYIHARLQCVPRRPIKTIPTEHVGGKIIDGSSLVALSECGGRTYLSRDELLWHYPHYRYGAAPYSIIRKGDWKLIKFWGGSRERYDLSTDPGGKHDLAPAHAENAVELEAMLTRRLAEGCAKLPRPNPAWVPQENQGDQPKERTKRSNAANP